jgi:prevent-host-death family protein
MPITTLTSRAFNQDTSRAKKAALAGPVIITDRGKPAHVLLSIRDYRKVLGKTRSIADLLAMPGAEDIELEVPVSKELARAENLA